MEDIVAAAKALGQRTNAKRNIDLVKKIITRATEILEDEEDPVNWMKLLKEPTTEIQNSKGIALVMSEKMRELGSKNGRHWKILCALIDLWIGPRSWYDRLRLADLEILIEDLASE